MSEWNGSLSLYVSGIKGEGRLFQEIVSEKQLKIIRRNRRHLMEIILNILKISSRELVPQSHETFCKSEILLRYLS